MGFFIFGQIASFLEIVFVLHFLIQFFGWKEEFVCRKTKTAGLCMILILVAQMNGNFRFSHLAVMVLDGIILMIFCRLYLKGTFQIQFLGCITPFLIVTMCNIVVMQIMALYRSLDVHGYMKTKGFGFITGVILSKILLAVFLQWILKKFEGRSLFLSEKYYHIINAVCVYMVIMEFLLYYVTNMGIYHREANILLEVISIGMAACTVYIGYSVYVISKKNVELAKYELMEVQNQEKERRLREIKRAEFRENQMIHDYKNHCLCIQNLLKKAQYEEAERYLAEILGKHLCNKKEFIHTENETLNALINSKIAYCKEKAIPIHCVILGQTTSMKKIEILVILFNLLDNAIEASEALEENERDIEVELCSRESRIEIFIRNNVAQSVLLHNPGFVSNKQGRHGIGHLSVEASVEELNGVIEYYEEHQQFCAHVIVPEHNV